MSFVYELPYTIALVGVATLNSTKPTSSVFTANTTLLHQLSTDESTLLYLLCTVDSILLHPISTAESTLYFIHYLTLVAHYIIFYYSSTLVRSALSFYWCYHTARLHLLSTTDITLLFSFTADSTLFHHLPTANTTCFINQLLLRAHSFNSYTSDSILLYQLSDSILLYVLHLLSTTTNRYFISYLLLIAHYSSVIYCR